MVTYIESEKSAGRPVWKVGVAIGALIINTGIAAANMQADMVDPIVGERIEWITVSATSSATDIYHDQLVTVIQSS